MNKKSGASFNPLKKASWADAAGKELKGDSPDILNFGFGQSINLKPYYCKQDMGEVSWVDHFTNSYNATDAITGAARSWVNVQNIPVGAHPQQANEAALSALNSGTEGIIFDFQQPLNDFAQLLKEILPEYCHLYFKINSREVSSLFNGLKKHPQWEDFKGGLWVNDPDTESLALALEQTITLPDFKILIICKNEEGDPVSHLAAWLQRVDQVLKNSKAVENYPLNAFRSIGTIIPMRDDVLLQMGMIRAVKILYTALIEAYGYDIAPKDHFTLALGSPTPIESLSPHSDIIKNTSGALASILGGADGICIEPADRDNPRLVRIARNTGLILREEAYLDKVNDPISGAYMINELVAQLVQKTWNSFLKQIKTQ